MKGIILLALVCSVSLAELTLARHHSSSAEWAHYKRQYGKVYAGAEEDARRFALFLAAKENIQRHNASPNSSYKMGLSHLSDWTEEELARLGGHRYDAAEHQRRLEQASQDPFLQAILDDPAPVPDELDWRRVPNRVSAVKDQGGCGSCWSFAVTGVLEGQQVVRKITKNLTSLSEQDLVDCSQNDYGCGGGTAAMAFKDLATMGGIESEKDYPYLGTDGQCKFNKSKSVMKVRGSVELPDGDETALKKVVAKYGPVYTAIDGYNLMSYKSGIFDDPTCTDELNHAVLVIGYGVDPKQGTYWILKNSWSAKWGESGYFRMKRDKSVCGIGKLSTIATF